MTSWPSSKAPADSDSLHSPAASPVSHPGSPRFDTAESAKDAEGLTCSICMDELSAAPTERFSVRALL